MLGEGARGRLFMIKLHCLCILCILKHVNAFEAPTFGKTSKQTTTATETQLPINK